MSTTDSITGFLFKEQSDSVEAIYTYVNDVVNPINDWAKVRVGKNYEWADAAARAAQTGMATGQLGRQLDNQIVYRYNGSAWKEWNSDWISWATAPTNFTIGTGGNASSSQRYKYVNGLVYCRVKFVLGSSGSSVGATPNITMPISLVNDLGATSYLNGIGNVYDASAPATFRMAPAFASSSQTAIKCTYDPGNAAQTNMSSSNPMASWAANDIWSFEFWAEPA